MTSPRSLFLPILLACFACEEDTLVHLECIPNDTKPCGLVGVEHLNSTGLCSFGITRCMSGGEWGECMGEVTPTEEVCDGRDNDCDGQTDEVYPEENQLCGMQENVNYGVGICTPGSMACDDGYLRCLGHEGPRPEVCDGVDNNCDGTVDESIPNQTAEVCYDGPPATLRVGICRAGVRYCIDGDTLTGPCEGQVLPQLEICDSLDNDCDGEVDEGFDSGKVDLIFVIDISGSFDDEIERTIFGIEPLLADPLTNDFQFGLVLIGTKENRNAVGVFRYMSRQTDFVPREDFMDHLNESLHLSRSGTSGQEPSYDALAYILEGRIGFSFREDAHKVIILMTDESGQSFDSPNSTEQTIAGHPNAEKFIFHVYNENRFRDDFDEIVRTNSNYHALESHSNASEVFESLRRIFLNVCGF